MSFLAFYPLFFGQSSEPPAIPPSSAKSGRIQQYRELETPISAEQSFHGRMLRRISASATIHGTELRQNQHEVELFGKLKQAISQEVRISKTFDISGKLSREVSQEAIFSGQLTRQILQEQILTGQLIQRIASVKQFKMTSLEPLSDKILRDLLLMGALE